MGLVLCGMEQSTPPGVAHLASDLASRLGSDVLLLNAVDDSPLERSHADRERARHSTLSEARAALEGIVRELDRPDDVMARVEIGSAREVLLEAARDEDAELLVVGSRGRGPFAAAVLGSLSRDLIVDAPCPVVIMPPKALEVSAADAAAPASVVCGVDGGELSTRAARLAGDIAGRLGDRLILAQATEWPRSVDRANLERVAPDAAATRVEEGPLGSALQRVASNERARLIVVGARAAGSTRAALTGSVTAHLVAHAAYPLLVLPEHAEIAPGSDHYALAGAA